MPSLYLLDTNSISAVMADDAKVKARLSLQPAVMTCAIVRGEIRYGLERLPAGKRRTVFAHSHACDQVRGLERLPAGKRRTDLENKATLVFQALPVEAVTAVAADIYGSVRMSLEAQGCNLSDNDLWIAATALSIGVVLVSNDHAFSNVPGLSVEDWTV